MENVIKILTDLFEAELELYGQYRAMQDYFGDSFDKTQNKAEKEMSDFYKGLAEEQKATLLKKYSKALEI